MNVQKSPELNCSNIYELWEYYDNELSIAKGYNNDGKNRFTG